MRILLLSTYFEPDIASTGVLMTQLARGLADLGHEVTVVASAPHYGTNRIWDAYRGKLVWHEHGGRLDIHRLWVYVPGDKEGSRGRVLNYASYNALSALVGGVVGAHDVILTPSPPLTNGLTADIIGRLRRIPFVYNVQDIWPDVAVRMGVMTNPRVIGFFHRLERYIYRRAEAVTVISEGFGRNLLAKGVPAEKVKVIPNFFDTEFVRPMSKENSFSVAHGLVGKFVVLFAGNIGRSQGLETVLEAAQLLADRQDIVFLVVGNGASKASLELYASKLGLRNVRFLPFQPQAELPGMYASSDVCLVPLRKGFTNESVPCKVYTIAAAARPMIAAVDEGSDTWRFVHRADCGLAVEPEDARAIAEAISALYSDAALRQRLGHNGRRHVVLYHTPKAVASQYNDILSQVVEERP